MVVLRSREILPNPSKPKSETTEPATPAQSGEGPTYQPSPLSNPRPVIDPPDSASSRRRSLRVLAATSGPAECEDSSWDGVIQNEDSCEGKVLDEITVRESCDAFLRDLSLRSGKRIVKRKLEGGGVVSGLSESNKRGKVKGKSVVEGVELGGGGDGVACLDGDLVGEDGFVLICENVGVGNEKFVGSQFVNGTGSGRRRGGRRDEAPAADRREDLEQGRYGEVGSSRGRRSCSREDKGKAKLEHSFNLSDAGASKMENELDSKIKALEGVMVDSVAVEERKKDKEVDTHANGSRMDQFKNIARRNASRFAHFEADEQEAGEDLSPSGGVEMPSVEEEAQVEDWPGPFSTAMKIIRDRANKLNSAQNRT